MRETRTYSFGLACALAVIAVLGVSAAAQTGKIDKQSFGQLERGHYLTIVGDCAACHTLPGSGHEFAGGRIIETPFGQLISPNITPDPVTGIGAWTDDEFVNALTKGTGRNGTRLYPAMPYTYYTKVTHDDALAIRAYLNSIPAVQNKVRSNQLPFPLDIRLGLAAWDELFFTPGEFKPDPNKSAETINLSTSQLNDDDVRGIAVYLKDQPGDPFAASAHSNQTAAAPAAAPDQNVMKVGAQIYADECSGCHTPNGKGVPGLFPSLNGAPSVQQTDPGSLLHVVLRGALSVATAKAPTGPEMPAFEWLLNDDQIAAVLTYIRNSWGNSAPAVSAGEASKARKELAERSD